VSSFTTLVADIVVRRPDCTQLPKLRMACSAGNSRARTMWSACEQCGAIAMVDLD
jgi:hypothetical protein